MLLLPIEEEGEEEEEDDDDDDGEEAEEEEHGVEDEEGYEPGEPFLKPPASLGEQPHRACTKGAAAILIDGASGFQMGRSKRSTGKEGQQKERWVWRNFCGGVQPIAKIGRAHV